jgi:glutamyl-tRNA synthetase
MNVRVRYAPSPTGLQHIGGLRTALFNYLLARSMGGVFYLRIEDTDQTRYNPEAEKDLYDTLAWAGIQWDEGPDKGGPFGPYVQSQRLDLYKKYAQQLVDQGFAYRCFCTSERLTEMRTYQEAHKLPLGYDRRCQGLSEAEVKELLEQKVPYVIRFKQKLEGTVVVEDALLGRVEKEAKDLPVDPILLKSDGFPTYHLAHVVDDHLMQTSHVLRAQEWLPSAPLHVQLFDAFGWERPQYVHLPLILGQDGQKLSKRHGATSVKQFKDSGYVAQAVVNYLALLGWSAGGDREFFPKEELEKIFALERFNKSPAIFDYKKLEHFNATYIRDMDPKALALMVEEQLVKAEILKAPVAQEQKKLIEGMIPLIHERLKYLTEAPESLRFVFQAVPVANTDDLVPKKGDRPKAKLILQNVIPLLEGFDGRTNEDNEALFRSKGEELGIKLGDFMTPVRVGVSGSKVSPPMFGTMKVLGTVEVKKRLEAALALLD